MSWHKVVDNDGMHDLVMAIRFALSDDGRLEDRAADTLKSLKINRNPLDRIADESDSLGEDWRVRVKQVGDDLLVMVYREVEYGAGHMGTYDMDEGEMFALFKRTGQVVVGTRGTFEKELGAR